MPEPININQLIASMAASAELLSNEMKNRTSGGDYPSGLADSIVVGDVKPIGDYLEVRISVKHPAGAAYEWGSGIHSTKGPKEKYPIDPKKAGGLLMFPEEKWPNFKFIPGSPVYPINGTFYLRHVEHPGVEARPYAEPSIQAKKKEIAKMIGRGFIASISRKEKDIVEIKVSV